MAKWTVALFGHHKENKDGRDIYRAQIGDVIAYKPDGHKWSDLEKKLFLIVTIDGPTQSQMEALVEPYYDIDGKTIYYKRRFSITSETLDVLGVDLEKMTDTTLLYTPDLTDQPVTVCYDKLLDRHVVESDGLNLISVKV